MTNIILSNNNFNLLSHPDDADLKITIFNQLDFNDVAVGVPAFFRHTKTFLQYGISQAQKTFHDLFHNVTHVGLVLNATNQEICIAEAIREGVITKCYSPKDLVQEDICFPLTKQVNHAFLNSVSKIAREKLGSPMQYDFLGAIQQSFIPKMFTESQKMKLIEKGIDHLLSGDLVLSKNKYFCSEFVLETIQTAYLHQLPIFQELIRNTSGLINATFSGSRSDLIQKIMNYLDVESIWKKISDHPLFHAPAAATSPADLFATQAQNSPIICVSSQDPSISPCDSQFNQNGIECLEYLAMRELDRYMRGEIININDPGMQELIAELAKKTDYSKETLSCIFEKLPGDQDLPKEIEKCLIETLSYQEQIMIYLVSSALSAGVDRLQENPSLLDRFQSSDSAVVEEAAKEMFPINPFQSRHFLTNIYILLSLQEKDPRFILKNLLLSILYDNSIAKKFTAVGIEKIYPVLEKITTLDKEIFQCLYNSCTKETMIPCADHCFRSEMSAGSLIVKNVQKELDEIIKKPEAWLEDLLEERQNPLNAFLNADLNQENLDPKIIRTLKPNNASSFRESLLPFAVLVYYTSHPQKDLDKLQNLLSFENAIKIANNKNITNKLIEKIALKYITKITSLNPKTLKCLIEDCDPNLPNKALDESEECLDQCVEPILPANKKKEVVREQLDSMIQKIEKEELSLLSVETIESIETLKNSNSFWITDLLVHVIQNQDLIRELQPDLISKLMKLSKKEWESKSIEEKLTLIMRLAYPKTYRILQLMNQENTKLAIEHFRIWNQIARHVKTNAPIQKVFR